MRMYGWSSQTVQFLLHRGTPDFFLLTRRMLSVVPGGVVARPGGCVNPPAALPNGTFYNNNIGECTATQVAQTDFMAEYIAGTFVWSGFDYLGEARGWPQNTKCRGTVADVAGFTKVSHTEWSMYRWTDGRMDGWMDRLCPVAFAVVTSAKARGGAANEVNAWAYRSASASRLCASGLLVGGAACVCCEVGQSCVGSRLHSWRRVRRLCFHGQLSFASCSAGRRRQETAYWLRSWWLSNISADDAGRPANPPAVAPAATGVPSQVRCCFGF
jgi:hypothetical protein